MVWKNIAGTEGDSGQYTFDFEDYYSNKAEGSYQRAGVSIPYEVSASARLEAALAEDGRYRYTLILPDADSVTPEEGILITEENLRPTASASVRADVKENDPDVPAKLSDAYVSSEISVIPFAN